MGETINYNIVIYEVKYVGFVSTDQKIELKTNVGLNSLYIYKTRKEVSYIWCESKCKSCSINKPKFIFFKQGQQATCISYRCKKY